MDENKLKALLAALIDIEPISATSRRKDGVKIYLAEDTEVIRRRIENVLRTAGFEGYIEFEFTGRFVAQGSKQ
jgi:hypothetical protein